MSTTAGKELVEDFLEHYGVKGMKWGVRKSAGRLRDAGSTHVHKVKAANAASAAKRTAPVPVKVKTSTTSAGKAKIAVSGGKRFPVDPDAVKAATVKRQYKKSGVDSLSNEQLQTLQNRLNLETNVDRLVKNDTRSQTFLQKLFKEQGQQQLDAINKDPIGSAKKAQAVADTIQAVAKKHKKK